MITTQMRRLLDSRNTRMERVASTATVPRETKTARMVTFIIKMTTMLTNIMTRMIILMIIKMESVHLQSCLSKRGRDRRKRNLARH